jgi:hypothetical protein
MYQNCSQVISYKHGYKCENLRLHPTNITQKICTELKYPFPEDDDKVHRIHELQFITNFTRDIKVLHTACKKPLTSAITCNYFLLLQPAITEIFQILCTPFSETDSKLICCLTVCYDKMFFSVYLNTFTPTMGKNHKCIHTA